MKKYDVYLEDKNVGSVELYSEGLYLHIVAKCTGIPPKFYRLRLNTDSDYVDLGICLQRNGSYIWDKRFPLKEVHGEIANFALVSSDTKQSLKFIAIDPTKRFPCFLDISRCVYAERSGEKGVCITDHSQDVQGC